ncbi:MAG: phosphotransferase family protein [Pseudomonadota bacterium]
MQSYDHAALERELAEHVEGFTTLDGLEKFSGGQSNPTYALTSGARRYVLRSKPPGRLLPSAHQVDREFRVMTALRGQVPVPRMFCLSGEESALGPQYIVMERVDGTVHWDPALPGLAPADRARVYDAMNAALAALHAVDPGSVGLGDFGKPGDYFARQLARWTKQYRAAATEPRPEVEWVIAWLEEAMPDDDGQVAVVHGDYRIDNMIFAADHTLSALLDWELSTLGHPMADLAYQVMVWRLPNAGRFKGLGGLDRAALGLPSDEDYVAAYSARSGVEAAAHWSYHLTFVTFRFLAILQGVLRRGLDGTASNPLGADVMRAAIEHLARDAKRIASGKDQSRFETA